LKITVCKFVNEEGLEDKVERLINKIGKARYRILCADDAVCQNLRLRGLSSGIIDYVDDFEVWNISHKIIDQWKAILKEFQGSKHLGVDILEFHTDSFAFTTKVIRLCSDLANQGHEVVIIVLNKYFNRLFPDLRTSSLCTIHYGPRFERTRGVLRILKEQLIRRSPNRGAVGRPKEETAKPPDGLCLITSSPTQEGELTEYYLRPAVSVLEQCRAMGISFKCVVDSPQMGRMLQRHRLDPVIVSEFRDGPLCQFLSLLKVLVHFVGLRRHTVRSASSDSSMKLSLPMVLQGLFYNCYSGITQISFFDRFITHVSPKIVLAVPDRGRMGRIGVEIARKYGIPSLTIQAGLIDEHPENGFLLADKVAVMGPQAKGIYLNRGVNPSQVFVTGMAHWDSLFRTDEARDRRELEEHGIDTRKTIVVFATENISLVGTVKRIQGTMSGVLNLDNTVLVIKVHPREDPDIYRKMAQSYPSDRILVVRDVDLHSLLNMCALLVDGFSNVALEAMMIDKPVVSINLSGKPDQFPFEEYRCALIVRNYDGIPTAIHRILRDSQLQAELKKGRMDFVAEYAYLADGKASQRTAEIIASTIGQHARRHPPGRAWGLSSPVPRSKTDHKD